jgi:hypothetical protein
VQGARYRVQEARYRVQEARYRVQEARYRVQGARYRVDGNMYLCVPGPITRQMMSILLGSIRKMVAGLGCVCVCVFGSLVGHGLAKRDGTGDRNGWFFSV